VRADVTRRLAYTMTTAVVRARIGVTRQRMTPNFHLGAAWSGAVRMTNSSACNRRIRRHIDVPPYSRVHATTMGGSKPLPAHGRASTRSFEWQSVELSG
jgi:hypothetical protein